MGENLILRYRLDGPGRGPIHSDRLAEMARQQLCNLLDIVQPLSSGEETAADSFRFLGPERKVYGLRGDKGGAAEEAPACPPGSLHCGGGAKPYMNLANAAVYEPRIEFIARQLASLLSVVELESGGQPVCIDGFRLRDPGDWTGPHAATPADIFNHAATRCQYDCVFCYNRGLPPSLLQEPHPPEDEWEGLAARVGFYAPRAGRGLYPTFGSPHEALAHPRILPLLRSLREKTGEPFRLCTNGGALDRDLVAALAELAPVYIDLSLNSASPRRRSLLMGDRHPETAMAAPALLSEAGIPYAVNVVAWPSPCLEEMLHDLEETAAFADASRARMVQVNLPGYSRFFAPQDPFDTEEVWGKTVRRVQKLRKHVSCPVFVSPSLYEENLTRRRKNQPEVIGVVKGSAAARLGLAAGDMVISVNGIPVAGRPQARDLLSLLQASGGRAALTVLRGGRELELCGNTGGGSYPFDTATGTHLGAVFMGAGLRASCLEKLELLVRGEGGKEVLFLTSTLVRPTLEQLLRERPLTLPEGTRLGVAVPRNRFFGGNIMLGDLLVVQDFIDFLREYARGPQPPPDLVVIPSSPFHLSGWGRDLTGRNWLDIERQTGVAVRLLECQPIWE